MWNLPPMCIGFDVDITGLPEPSPKFLKFSHSPALGDSNLGCAVWEETRQCLLPFERSIFHRSGRGRSCARLRIELLDASLPGPSS